MYILERQYDTNHIRFIKKGARYNSPSKQTTVNLNKARRFKTWENANSFREWCYLSAWEIRKVVSAKKVFEDLTNTA